MERESYSDPEIANQPRHGSVAAAEAGAKRATGLLP
jgi:hypothetical protein